MHLNKLNLINFKNYSEKELQFSAKINCFVGKNGVGKTNLLDAIYYLSFCKSYFNPVDSQNVSYEAEFFVIQGEYLKDSITENIICSVKKNDRKHFKRNDKEYNKLSEHIGLIPLVMISPVDKILIIGGSDERRKFINHVISQYDLEYLEDVIKYNKAILNRNKLLKNFAKSGDFNHELLEVWNEQIIPLGERIHKKRVEFIEKFLPVFQKFYEFISLKNESVELIYESQLNGNDFRDLLKSSINKDRILQYTTFGTHKDDLLFNLQENQIKKAGSQGQQKTFLIALKLAQFEFIKEISKSKPILLLDDIFDKLDSERVSQIVKLVADDNFGQIFITDTSKDRLDRILKASDIEYELFYIEKD